MRPTSGFARALTIGVAAALVALALDSVINAVMAQNPFGGPRPTAEPQVGGIVGWLLSKQSEFYREMSSTIRAAKSDGSAVFSRRRARSRQGGDLVLSGRQPGDRAPRHRAVVCIRADAVAGRGGDRRDLRLAAQRHRENHVRGRKGDRDRKLHADRGLRRPAGLDQGRRIHSRAAGAPPATGDGAGRSCPPRPCRPWTRPSSRRASAFSRPCSGSGP
jgi:hypothetical protein